MKLSDEEIEELFNENDTSCIGFDEFYRKSFQAIRQLMAERDKYRNIVNKLIMMEPEKECHTFVLNSDDFGLNSDTLEWEVAKQALEKDDETN
jgi:hypothetical protein